MTEQTSNLLKAGIFYGLNDTEYNAIPALRSTVIKQCEHSMEHFKAAWDSKENDNDTQAKIDGRAIHAAILESHTLTERYIAVPERPDVPGILDGSDEYRAFIRQHNESLPAPIDDSDPFTAVHQLPEAVKAAIPGKLEDKRVKVHSKRDELIETIKSLPEDYHPEDGAKISDMQIAIRRYNEQFADPKVIKAAIAEENTKLPKPLTLGGTNAELKERILSVDPSIKFWDEEKQKIIEGKTVLPEASMNMVERIALRVEAHSAARKVLEKGNPEVSAVVQHPDTGLWLKVKMDWYRDDMARPVILDVKSSSFDINNRWAVSATIRKYGYHISAALYSEVIYLLTGKLPVFGWLFVEKYAPYSIRMWQASPDLIEEGHSLLTRYLFEIKHCIETDTWPGYPEAFEVIGLGE